jgi:hypothetical protein
MKFITLTHSRTGRELDVRIDLIESLRDAGEEGTLVRLTTGSGMYVAESRQEIYGKTEHQFKEVNV